MNCAIYLISPPEFELVEFASKLSNALSGGDVAVFQLRMKNATDQQIIESGNKLKEICHQNNVQFILNDRADLAKTIDADGLHIGINDNSYQDARNILGDEKIIGVSCYNSIDRAMNFGEMGANYVAFGAFFPSNTKKKAELADKKILESWTSFSSLPCVAIGGIDVNNCKDLVNEGVDFIAVISTIWNHPKGELVAIKELADKINHI